MWTVIELIFDFFSFRQIFGNTGRLLVKVITFGQIDLDLNRWGHCFISVVIGLAVWCLAIAACIALLFPEVFKIIGELKGGSL